MTKLNPYLTFPGTAAEAIKHYTQVFNTRPDAVSHFSDMSQDSGMPSLTPEGDDDLTPGSQNSVSVPPDIEKRSTGYSSPSQTAAK